jgi:MFS family permease
MAIVFNVSGAGSTRPFCTARHQIRSIPGSRLTTTELEKYRRLPWSLAHIFLNNFFYTWTFGGSIFLLFLDELGLPKDQIGILLSFFPFMGLLALGFGSLVAKWGRKRVFLLGYGIRKPVMASLLFLPWILAYFNRNTALVFLFLVILTVAILRAIAETGFLPWFQEFVPNAVRGKYAAVNNIIYTISSIIALTVASWVIGESMGISGYMLLIGAGAAIGLVGVILMLPVPGGKPIPGKVSSRVHLTNLLMALQDSNFRYYMGGMASFIIGSVALASFLPLFIKEEFSIPAQTIVTLEIASMIGGALASIIGGVSADKIGSRPVMIPGLVLTIFLPIGWIVFSDILGNIPSISNTIILISFSLLYFLYGAFATTASIGAGRLLYNDVIPVEKSTAYTSIYYAWAGLIGGLSPILAGKFLNYLSTWQVHIGFITLDGFRLLFIFSIFGFISAYFFYRLVRPDAN